MERSRSPEAATDATWILAVDSSSTATHSSSKEKEAAAWGGKISGGGVTALPEGSSPRRHSLKTFSGGD